MNSLELLVWPRKRGDRIPVIDVATGEVVATLGLTAWGKWKIVGEDTYAKTPELLLERLEKREEL